MTGFHIILIDLFSYHAEKVNQPLLTYNFALCLSVNHSVENHALRSFLQNYKPVTCRQTLT